MSCDQTLGTDTPPYQTTIHTPDFTLTTFLGVAMATNCSLVVYFAYSQQMNDFVHAKMAELQSKQLHYSTYCIIMLK